MAERGFGRRYAPDQRDRRFLLAPPAAAPGVERRMWYATDVFDQGPTSQCTAYAAVGWLRAGPVRNTKALPSFQELYADFQRNDEWPGEEPDYEGSSIRASMKVLRRRGYVSEYRWAFDAATAINHVLSVSPMILGTDWLWDMLETDRRGFIRADGRMVGGHAYLAIGADRSKKCPDGTAGAVRVINSWSRKWGSNGRAWLGFSDLDKLIRANGEAATAFEAKPAP